MKILAALASLALIACGGSESQGPTVEVYESLKSLQCIGGGTTVAALRSQLTEGGVEVLASSCGLDGNGYPAVCGAPDGAIAIFEVRASQQPLAEELGFAALSKLPSATRVACR